jgi:hypothetical protein
MRVGRQRARAHGQQRGGRAGPNTRYEAQVRFFSFFYYYFLFFLFIHILNSNLNLFAYEPTLQSGVALNFSLEIISYLFIYFILFLLT